MKYFIGTIFLSIVYTQVFYTNLPDSTGVYQPIIIENCIGLDIGDEIGLFDANGLISNDCTNQYDEILVGSGTWEGEQLSVAAISSVDLSQFGGPILPGSVSGNDMVLKVWDVGGR